MCFKLLQLKIKNLHLFQEMEDEGNDAVQEDSYNQAQTYQRYNQSMVEASESVQKPYLNFDEDKSKRHCTEVDDEYDAIGKHPKDDDSFKVCVNQKDEMGPLNLPVIAINSKLTGIIPRLYKMK